jgi:cytochrome bd ubiquinol oxidase subunit I
MTRFWGKLFGINFALGVTTGITMEFQFGTNWAYYSHYVGDIFGAPLAIEGLMAFFLESTFIGLFFFGWDRLSKTQHLMVTILMAVGTNLSALWILIANGWMQNPVGAEFSFETMRMEMTTSGPCVFNPDAQAKFVHTVSAGYVTGAMFVLSVISSWYLLKGRDTRVRQAQLPRRRRLRPGLVRSGDRAGRRVGLHRGRGAADQDGGDRSDVGDRARARRLKLVAGINEAEATNDWEIEIPWVHGPDRHALARQADPGIKEIKEKNRERIESGIQAVVALEAAAQQGRRTGQGGVRAAQGRPRFRPAAAQVHRRREPGHARDDPAGGGQHRAAGGADVLELPHHGRRWASPCWCCSASRCSIR